MIFGYLGRLLFGSKRATEPTPEPEQPAKRAIGSGGPDKRRSHSVYLSPHKDQQAIRLAKIQQEDEEILLIILSAMELIQ